MNFTGISNNLQRFGVGLAGCALLVFLFPVHRASATSPYSGIDLYTLTPPNGLTSFTLPQPVLYAAHLGSISNGGQVVGKGTTPDGATHAVFSTSAGISVDLHPSQFGAASSKAVNISGTQQVGFLSNGSALTDHAVLWNGSAASAVDLNPSQLGASVSYAFGTDGIHQVGEELTHKHALLWSGTAASAVDLHPGAYGASMADAVSGNSQVGASFTKIGLNAHAFLWHGTAASGVDLHPTILDNNSQPLFTYSFGLAVSGSQQAGYAALAANNQITHAIMWTGTAASAVDLNPEILLGSNTYSVAYGTNGIQQVGMAAGDATAQNLRAIVWQGTAASAIDLQQYLPPVFSFSAAYSIDSQGVIYGIGFRANGSVDAVKWLPVPEPSTWFMLLISSPAIFLHRRKSMR